MSLQAVQPPIMPLDLIVKSDQVDEFHRYLREKFHRAFDTHGDKTLLMLLLIKKAKKCALLLLDNYSNLPLNAVDETRRTALHYACIAEFPDIICILLRRGASPFIKDVEEWTPLHFAAFRCNEVVLEQFANKTFTRLEQDSLRETFFPGTVTPLHLAASGASSMQVGHMAKIAPDINVPDEEGKTALHRATHTLEHVLVLLRAKANLNLLDAYNQTPLCIAAWMGNYAVCAKLLEHGTLVHLGSPSPMQLAFLKGLSQIIELFRTKGAAPVEHVPDATLGQDLYGLILEGNLFKVADALKSGVRIGSTSNVLHRVSDTRQSDPLQIKYLIDLLLHYGASLEARNDVGESPLAYALRQGHDIVSSHLLECGADPNAKDTMSNTPLITFCEQNNYTKAERLILAGANRNVKGTTTPLLSACMHGNFALAKLLLNDKIGETKHKSHVADPNRRINGTRPLIYVIERLGALTKLPHQAKPYQELFDLLLKHRVNVNKKVQHGTALILSLQNKLPDIAEALVAHGADPTIVPDGCQSAHHFARLHGYEKLARTLVEQAPRRERADSVDRIATSIRQELQGKKEKRK